MKKYYNKDNQVIYNMDNLELLKELKSNSIDLIYCDILYNTGKVFDDYNDNLGNSKEATEWYRPRLTEMKRVLKDNGSIFLHCNWRMDSYIRVLMDELFGEKNFRNRIYRKHSEERGFFKNFDSQIDIILYYTKSVDNFTFNELIDDIERITPLYENGYIKGRSIVLNIDNKEIDLKELNKHLLISENRLNYLISKNEVVLIDNLPYRKTYSKPIGNLWNEEEMLDNYSRNKVSDTYDTPKPEAVLDRIIRMCSNENDTVADFFLGGGTTAVVAKKLNRKGIYCDISKKACDTTISKLEKLDVNNISNII